MMAGQILFVYRGKKGTCSAITIHRKLHGLTAIRVKKTETGGTVHKPYSYPGVPHRDVIPGAFFVSVRDEKEITGFFEKYKVPHIRIRPREVKTSNWLVGGAIQKREAV